MIRGRRPRRDAGLAPRPHGHPLGTGYDVIEKRLACIPGTPRGTVFSFAHHCAAHMPIPKSNEILDRPAWLVNFQAWVARLSPSTIADLIDLLAIELDRRHADRPLAPGPAAENVQAFDGARIERLVDEFLVGSPRGSR